MKRLVVLTGAGISAESGIPTFRDAGGLWEGHQVDDVATPEGWFRNPKMVLDFYNERRKKALAAEPNRGHKILAELEEHFTVTVVTQNVDNLHERAGSSHVVHLHGSLFESRSTVNENLIYPITGWALHWGDLCEEGSQLRPNVVWFGELVPMMDKAMELTYEADYFLVVGTSLQVYPAAGLLNYVKPGVPVYVVDPKAEGIRLQRAQIFKEKASTGLEKVSQLLLRDATD